MSNHGSLLMPKIQSGFTLIELMISLTLGLIITAAATVLFITGQKGYALQQGMSSNQENANFGLNFIVKDIRHANLSTPAAQINDDTLYAGIVFTSSVNGRTDTTKTPNIKLSNLPLTIVGTTASADFLSAKTFPSNVKSTTADLTSDQLTIQYLPPYKINDKGTADTTDDLWFGGYDCEGNKLEYAVGANNTGRRMVVQRYFLRLDDNNEGTKEPNQPYALACDAGTYTLDGANAPTSIQGFGGDGQIIMKRIDQFRVLYGVIDSNSKFRYVSAATYKALAVPRPRIVGLQLSALSRSTQSIGKDTAFKSDQKFKLLDQTVTVKTPLATNPNYVRQVVTQTIALRNTFGDRE